VRAPQQKQQEHEKIRRVISRPNHHIPVDSATTLSSSVPDISDTVSAIDTFYQTAPYTSAFITCGIKASAADLFAQRRELSNDAENDDNDNNNNSDGSTDFQPGRINASYIQHMDQPASKELQQQQKQVNNDDILSSPTDMDKSVHHIQDNISSSIPPSVAAATMAILSSPQGQNAIDSVASSSFTTIASASTSTQQSSTESSSTESSLVLPIINKDGSTSLSTTTTTTNINTFQLDRNVAFILYGGFYQGMAQQFIYNSLFPSMFGTSKDVMTVLIKVSFDLLIISPFVCLPIAYITKAVIFNTSSNDNDGTSDNGTNALSFWTDSFSQAMDKYSYDIQYQNVIGKFWAIWLPAQICTFSIVPDHLRIVFIAFISFFWLILLSTISAATGDDENDK